MRRRRRLQVDTSPFLAVLLCAMGSLILVLLVMDRRARLAARQRSEQTAASALEERRREQARQLAEQKAKREEAQRQAREAWELQRQKLHDDLASQKQQLDQRVETVKTDLRAAEDAARREKERLAQLKLQAEAEKRKRQEHEQALARKREEAERARRQAEAEAAELKRKQEEVARREEEFRKQEQEQAEKEDVYSLVPYRGKHGENRRPIYVECSARGVIFHPGGTEHAKPINHQAVRAELKNRIAALPPDDKAPYCLLLIRPGGIRTYYDFQDALEGMTLDFGYELVDEGWSFEVPQPTVTAKVSEPGGPGGSEGGTTGPALPPLIGTSPGPLVGAPVGSPPTGLPGMFPDGGVTGGKRGAEAPGPPVATLGQPGLPRPAESRSKDRASTGEKPDRQTTDASAAARSAAESRPGDPGTTGASPDGGTESGGTEFASDKAPRKPLQAARLGADRVDILFVECRENEVIIYPAAQRISLQELAPRTQSNPLYQAASQLAQRAGPPPPGEEPKVQIRFLVRPDGLRAFHHAYPLVEGLPIPKYRQNLHASTDILSVLHE